MVKKDIARRIEQHADISKDEAAEVLEWILSLLKTTLQAGEPIIISGFGKFTVRNKHARPGRNPRTGEAMMVSARRAVTFHASLPFKAAVNSTLAECRVSRSIH
ncbi:MAG: integration host factor subunit alpha [Nitrospira sp. BO4]|jgi:integration host factor subunit alpha|nr:integration host factor subunit alpha [Nitrospira sp. BO4]